MKKETKRLAALLAVASGLATVGSLQAQPYVLSDFHNFTLSATYANWDADGSQLINGGSGFDPVLTSGPTSFEVMAQGYGSGAYNFSTPINASGATGFAFTFTINTPMQHGDGSGLWFGPNLDIADGTHLVQMTAVNAGAGYLDYGPYVGPGTYTLYGSLGDLDTSTITAFNIECDPAEYGGGAPYDITYQSLVLTPEPGTLALLGLGVAGALIAKRRS